MRSEPFHGTITEIGASAAAVFRTGQRGRVAAVFSRSLYLESEAGRWACLGCPSIGAGPLNALIGEGIAPLLPGLAPGTEYCIEGSVLRIPKRAVLRWQGAALWRPPVVPSPVSRESLRRNLDALLEEYAPHVPPEGIGGLVFPGAAGYGNMLERVLAARAKPAMDAMGAWLTTILGAHDAPPSIPGEAAALFGLGPGLTPSGDDFIAGMLIALRMLGENGAADAVARWALPLAKQRTNRISVAHLEAAVEGQGAAALHQVLGWLGSSGSKTRLPEPHFLSRMGHCSGWDMLSGVVMACRGYVQVTARLPFWSNGSPVTLPVSGGDFPVSRARLVSPGMAGAE